MTKTETDTPRVVLASRRNGGIQAAHDDSTDDDFELFAEPGTNPMNVFKHPYAYAASRGIHYRTADLRQSA